MRRLLAFALALAVLPGSNTSCTARFSLVVPLAPVAE